MVEFFHNVDFLIDVFLKKRFFLDQGFGNDFDCKKFFRRFLMKEKLLLRATTTYPKAPLPMDLIV